MAYITYDEYVAIYGQNITEADFPMYAENASDMIDMVTRYEIVQCGGISAQPPLVQNLVKKAVAAQVLYYSQNGIDTVMSGQTGQGFTVGKVHLDGTSSGSESGNSAAQLMISPAATAFLEQTGLMGRNVGCLDLYRSACLHIP